MLSAIEQFGPAPGPSAALLPYATAYHHHQQFEQQHLAYLPSAQPAIAHFGLLSPPLSSPASVSSLSNGVGGGASSSSNSSNNNNNSSSNNSNQNLCLKSLQQHADLKDAVGLSDSHKAFLLQQQHHLHQQQQHDLEKSAMSAHEFSRPRHGATTISLHPLPLQHLNSVGGGGLKNNCSPQASYVAAAAQSCSPPYVAATPDQAGPMNLVTNQSGGGGSSGSGGEGGGSIYVSSSPYHYRSPSSSSSVDIENDDSMSPPTVQHLQHQQQHHQQQQQVRKAADLSMPAKSLFEHHVPTTTPSYPPTVDYAHLYARRTALYGAPLFSPAHHHVGAALRPHAAYLNALAPTANGNAFSLEYLKAMQNAAVAAAAGIFQHAPLPPVTQTPHTQHQHQPQLAATAALPPSQPPLTSAVRPSAQGQGQALVGAAVSRIATTGSMLALAPPGPVATSPNDPRYAKCQNSFEAKRDHGPPASSKKYASGTYLNKASATPPTGQEAENFFKVPSGKEGSLKHRILTRPASGFDKCDKSAVMRTHNSTSNFRKGSCIELFNGQMRKVEDMRTEDFIKCAERCPQHQLIESTVVKITIGAAALVLITFSYDKNRLRADIEVSAEHPFFVYGQGWASCNPEMSQKAFGLKCQRLQVGDICISLSKRDTAPGPERQQQKTAATTQPQAKVPQTAHMPTLSPTTKSTTATTLTMNHLNVYPYQPSAAVAVSMHLLAPPPPPLPQSLGPPQAQPHHPFAVVDMAEMMALSTQHHHHLTAATVAAHQQHLFRVDSERLSHHHQLQQQQQQHQHYYKNEEIDNEMSDTVDASDDTPSASRKRRWSAPESSVCDSETDEAIRDCVPADGADVVRRLNSQPGTSADYTKIFVTYAKARKQSTEAHGNLTA